MQTNSGRHLMIRRATIVVLVCGGLGFFLQREAAQGTFDPWHRAVLNRLNGPSPAAPVVIVELRRRDLPFESWPPAPLDYALVLESLVRRQPSAVAVDSLLAWPEVATLDAATLAERIALLPHGVLACTLQRGTVATPGEVLPPVPLVALPNVLGDTSRLPDFSGAGQMPVDEVRGSKGVGFTRIEFGAGAEVGETSITIPLLARRGKEVVPSLLLQTLMAWKGRGAADITIELGRRIVIATDLVLRIDESGRYAIYFHLGPTLRRTAAGSLLLDLEEDGKLLKSEPVESEALHAMRGALVVLGETGETTLRFPVGPGREWTETELIAQGLAAALTGSQVGEMPRRWQWALWAAITVAGMALPACSRRWIIGFALAGAAVLALTTMTAFLLVRWWMPPLPPLALWTAASVVALLISTPPTRQRSGSVDPPPDSPAPLMQNDAAAQPASEDAALARALVGDESTPAAAPAVSSEDSTPPRDGPDPASSSVPTSSPKPKRKGNYRNKAT